MSFFQHGPLPADAIFGTYNINLVILSYVIAAFASYIALDFAGRLRIEANHSVRIWWLIGGAFAMGAGIWSMHFIGMLAFIMPMPMSYDTALTSLSLLVAISSAAFVLYLLQNDQRTKTHLIIGGIFLGFGIASMHYIGMSAMLGMTIQYIPALFALSIVIAIVASEVALWLIVKSNKGSYRQQVKLKLISAFIMGFAICGMHYTGMFAAVFTPQNDMGTMEHAAAMNSDILALYITGITGIILTIALIVSTYKQLMVSALENEKNFLNAILDNLSDGILACDSHGDITVYNKALQHLTETDAMTIAFHQPNNEAVIPPDEQPLKRVLRGEKIEQLELELRTSHDARRYVVIDGQPIFNNEEKNTGAVIAVHDITEQKELEGQLIYQATHDALTQLPGRILLLDRINSAIAQASRNKSEIAVLFVDLDHFKTINDSFGHDAGDDLLKTVSERMTASIRASDTVSRHGGDEFIILLSSLENENTVVSIHNKISQAVAQDYMIGDHVINMMISVGISIYPKDGTDATTLMKNADIAMYRSKSLGRNTFQFYTEEMNINSMKRLDKELALQHALEHNEFTLNYQPVFDLVSDSITGVEALLRWNHPVLGSVPPLDFIPIAEELGLIIPIGAWVLETACKQNVTWQKAGLPPVKMAINVSGKQLNNSDFLDTVKHTLTETGLAPEYLELEITESVVLENPDKIIECLHALKAMGIHIALDDFGTGYSSLNYLAQLPIHKIKIDRSFVKHLDNNVKKSTIVLAIIGMASSLKLKVTAEGAETENEMTFLRFNRCDQVQGFYLCHPLSTEECTRFLWTHKKAKDNKKQDE